MASVLESELAALGGSDAVRCERVDVSTSAADRGALELRACQRWLDSYDSILVDCGSPTAGETTAPFVYLRTAAAAALQSHLTDAVELTWALHAPALSVDVVRTALDPRSPGRASPENAPPAVAVLRASTPETVTSVVAALAKQSSAIATSLALGSQLADVVSLRRICHANEREADAAGRLATLTFVRAAQQSQDAFPLVVLAVLLRDVAKSQSLDEPVPVAPADQPRFALASRFVSGGDGATHRDGSGSSTHRWLGSHPLLSKAQSRRGMPSSVQHPMQHSSSLFSACASAPSRYGSRRSLPPPSSAGHSVLRRAFFAAGIGNGGFLTLLLMPVSRSLGEPAGGGVTDLAAVVSAAASRVMCRAVRRTVQPACILRPVTQSPVPVPSGDFSPGPIRVSGASILEAAGRAQAASQQTHSQGESAASPATMLTAAPPYVRVVSPVGESVSTAAPDVVVSRGPQTKVPPVSSRAPKLGRPPWQRPTTVSAPKPMRSSLSPQPPHLRDAAVQTAHPAAAAHPAGAIDGFSQSELAAAIASGLTGLEARSPQPPGVTPSAVSTSPPRLASALTLLRDRRRRPVGSFEGSALQLLPGSVPSAAAYLGIIAHEAALATTVEDRLPPPQVPLLRSGLAAAASGVAKSDESAPSRPGVQRGVDLIRAATATGDGAVMPPRADVFAAVAQRAADGGSSVPLQAEALVVPTPRSGLSSAAGVPLLPIAEEADGGLREHASLSVSAVSADSIADESTVARPAVAAPKEADSVLPPRPHVAVSAVLARAEAEARASPVAALPEADTSRDVASATGGVSAPPEASASRRADAAPSAGGGYFARAVRRQLQQHPPVVARAHPTAVYGGGVSPLPDVASPPPAPPRERVDGWGGAPETPAPAPPQQAGHPPDAGTPPAQRALVSPGRTSPSLQVFYPPRSRSHHRSQRSGTGDRAASPPSAASTSSSSSSSSLPPDSSVDASRLSRVANDMRHATPVAAALFVDVLGDAYERAAALRGKSASALWRRRGGRRWSTGDAAAGRAEQLEATAAPPAPKFDQRVRAKSAPRALATLLRSLPAGASAERGRTRLASTPEPGRAAAASLSIVSALAEAAPSPAAVADSSRVRTGDPSPVLDASAWRRHLARALPGGGPVTPAAAAEGLGSRSARGGLVAPGSAAAARGGAGRAAVSSLLPDRFGSSTPDLGPLLRGGAGSGSDGSGSSGVEGASGAGGRGREGGGGPSSSSSSGSEGSEGSEGREDAPASGARPRTRSRSAAVRRWRDASAPQAPPASPASSSSESSEEADVRGRAPSPQLGQGQGRGRSQPRWAAAAAGGEARSTPELRLHALASPLLQQGQGQGGGGAPSEDAGGVASPPLRPAGSPLPILAGQPELRRHALASVDGRAGGLLRWGSDFHADRSRGE